MAHLNMYKFIKYQKLLLQNFYKNIYWCTDLTLSREFWKTKILILFSIASSEKESSTYSGTDILFSADIAIFYIIKFLKTKHNLTKQKHFINILKGPPNRLKYSEDVRIAYMRRYDLLKYQNIYLYLQNEIKFIKTLIRITILNLLKYIQSNHNIKQIQAPPPDMRFPTSLLLITLKKRVYQKN